MPKHQFVSPCGQITGDISVCKAVPSEDEYVPWPDDGSLLARITIQELPRPLIAPRKRPAEL